MEGKPWYVYVLRLLIAWLRERINALAAKIESSRRKKREGISSSSSSPAAALTSLEPAAATESSVGGRSADTTLAAKHFPSEAASTHEEAVETIEGVDAPDEQRGREAIDESPAKWPIGQSLSFTPDASLDLVDDIEFVFVPEPAAADDQPVGWVEGDGSRECPESFPIKGNGTSHIYHLPREASYATTIADQCFATEQDAVENGYRPTKRNRPS